MIAVDTGAARADVMVLNGVVVAEHRGDLYDVDVQAGSYRRRVKARRCGKMNQRSVRVVVGDRVTVEVSAYDLSRGRIVRRL